jgi:hypothetical protein
MIDATTNLGVKRETCGWAAEQDDTASVAESKELREQMMQSYSKSRRITNPTNFNYKLWLSRNRLLRYYPAGRKPLFCSTMRYIEYYF